MRERCKPRSLGQKLELLKESLSIRSDLLRVENFVHRLANRVSEDREELHNLTNNLQNNTSNNNNSQNNNTNNGLSSLL